MTHPPALEATVNAHETVAHQARQARGNCGLWRATLAVEQAPFQEAAEQRAS